MLNISIKDMEITIQYITRNLNWNRFDGLFP